ncbi:MAG: ADP-glyceromanno-heptose 6-epimerase [Bdellovibrionota bacterium]
MYIVTGGAGFIGSAFVAKLNQEGINDILIVDNLGDDKRWLNLRNLVYTDIIGVNDFISELMADISIKIDGIIHMGACSSTTEMNVDFLLANNYQYTKTLATYAINNGIRFIYASSGATYGAGEAGYDDFQDEKSLLTLKPLNPYGFSKHLFDIWAARNKAFSSIAGLKFFNVFGPNEYHKGDMASMVKKSYETIKETGKVKLFKSYDPRFKDGESVRDFVYIKDVVEVMWRFLKQPKVNGLYNVGTGEARSWNDLMKSVFSALNLKPNIEYIDMPEKLRKQYQYYTKANMEKFEKTNMAFKFYSLEDAVKDYVQNYMETEDPYLGKKIK